MLVPPLSRRARCPVPRCIADGVAGWRLTRHGVWGLLLGSLIVPSVSDRLISACCPDSFGAMLRLIGLRWKILRFVVLWLPKRGSTGVRILWPGSGNKGSWRLVPGRPYWILWLFLEAYSSLVRSNSSASLFGSEITPAFFLVLLRRAQEGQRRDGEAPIDIVCCTGMYNKQNQTDKFIYWQA